MSVFEMYFQLGFAHIADLAGYDHILFIITLCSVYFLPRWKELLVLITAFTLGHTLTLALATLNILNISSSVIEFLIPLTILFVFWIDTRVGFFELFAYAVRARIGFIFAAFKF